MKTTIYVVRHGEVYNPEKVYYGRIPGYFLSENGKEQVHRLGKHLKGKSIKKIYASPLDRTKQTASILAEYFPGVEITYDERLLEVGSPPLEGKLLSELETFNANFYLDEYVQLGGETLEDIKKRMIHMLQDIAKDHEDEDVIVVSHGDPIMITRSYYLYNKVDLVNIRGNDYIPTAHGIEIELHKDHVSVKDITPKKE